jgi:hypothetical protein
MDPWKLIYRFPNPYCSTKFEARHHVRIAVYGSIIFPK